MQNKKWFTVVVTICLLIIISVLQSSDGKTLIANAKTNSITIEYKMPDDGAVLIDGLEDYNLINKWINDRQFFNETNNHTGWSAVLYKYDEEILSESGSHWIPISNYYTRDSFSDKTYPVSILKNKIIADYGEELYNALVKSGKRFVPRGGMEFPDYNVYSIDTREMVKNPKTGDRAFIYNENDFNVYLTFTMEELEIDNPDIPDLPVPEDKNQCIENPSSCSPIEPTDPIEPIIPEIGKGGVCPSPYIPEQIKEPFYYEMDLITERIEGQTVDKGQQTVTPVTVYRADYSDKRQGIKDDLQADLEKHKQLQAECEKVIQDLESQLATIELQLSQTTSAYNACLNTSYPIYDKDGKIIGYDYPDCSSYPPAISSLQSQVDAKREEIKLANITLIEIGNVISAIEYYISTIEYAEENYSIIPTSVELSVNGQRIDEKPIALRENERQVLEYNWTLAQDSKVKGFIDPRDNYKICDKSKTPCEITNNNNAKETPIYISSREAVKSCSIDGNTTMLQGIVRTIQEGDSISSVKNVYEYVSSRLVIDPNEKNRRAGYGFHYKVYTEYINEDVAYNRNTKGVTQSSAFKPDILTSYLPYTYNQWTSMKTTSTQVAQNTLVLEGYKVPNLENTFNSSMNNSSLPFRQIKEWELPKFSVERYSGNVFKGSIAEAQNNVNHNPNDELLDGGRKWYLDWYQPDGTFSFDVVIEDIGVNRLTLCNTGEVMVKGTSIGDENGDSDFVFRFIDPTKPFPGGTGWNWIGLETAITSIRNWWTDRSYPNPNDIPYNYHEEHYQIQHE